MNFLEKLFGRYIFKSLQNCGELHVRFGKELAIYYVFFFRVRYFYEVLNKENKIVYLCIFLLGD